jgi:hypothetical protein
MLITLLLATAFMASAGEYTSPVWEFPTSPAELAWGNAALSLAYPPRGMTVNPAMLSQIKWREFCGSGILWFQGTSGGSMNGVLPLGGWGTSAAAISYWDYGQLERYSEMGLPQGSLNPYAASAAFSYGANVYQKLSLGLSFKGSLQSLEDSKEYQLGTDLSSAYRFKYALVNLMLRNWGPKYPLGDSLKYDLPLTVSCGAAANLFKDKLKAALQINNAKGGDWYPSAAVAVSPWPVLALRAGYDGRPDAVADSRIGFGLSVNQTGQQDYSLEYGYRSFGDLGTVHAVSIGMSF